MTQIKRYKFLLWLTSPAAATAKPSMPRDGSPKFEMRKHIEMIGCKLKSFFSVKNNASVTPIII